MKSVFGLDIGSYTLKAVQVRYHGEKAELLAASIITLPDSLDNLLSKNPQSLAETIKKAVASSKPNAINTKFVVSALPESKVYTETISMPKMEEEELKTALPLEAAKHMPMPLDQSYLDYDVYDQENEKIKKLKKSKQLNIFAVAAPRRLVDNLRQVIRSAGFELVVLETKPLAAIRALITPELTAKHIIIFDIGAKNSSVTITCQNKIILAATTSSGGDVYIETIEKELKVKRKEALNIEGIIKKDEAAKERILKVLFPLFENAVIEIQKAIKYYEPANQGEIDEILLAGVGSITPGLCQYIQEGTGIKTTIASPFSNLEDNELAKNIMPQEAASLTTSVGLALRKVN